MLYYTLSTDEEITLISHTRYQNTPQQSLYDWGCEILSQYHNVLARLSPKNQIPCNVRLQTAFAAAVFDISEVELQRKDAAELDDLRKQGAGSLFTPDTAPPLVVYLGRKREPARIKSSPSTISQLSFTVSSGGALNDDGDFDSWAQEWNATEGPWPCRWGWHTKDLNSKFSFIFLSGAYAVWPTFWTRMHMLTEAPRLQVHLQVTLFHELVHAARTEIYGPPRNTPEKPIDHPFKFKVKNGVGEAGRYAEKLAFGGVVDLCLESNHHICLFTTDPAQEAGKADFQLPDELVHGLLSSSTPPIDYWQLETAKLHIQIPEYARSKSGAGCEEVAEIIGKLPPVDLASPPQHMSAPVDALPSGLIPATGYLKAYIEQNREALKPRCVED